MVGIKLKSRIGEKGQVVIPKPIRDLAGLKPDTDAIFGFEDGKVIIEPAKADLESLQEFFDAFKGRNFKIPRNHDWNKDYDEEMEERWKKFT